jgi:hypothetical protein
VRYIYVGFNQEADMPEVGKFWVGSNGNLFCDSAKHRYSVCWHGTQYRVARDGIELDRYPSLTAAKMKVKALVRAD